MLLGVFRPELPPVPYRIDSSRPEAQFDNYEKTQKSKAALAFCNECLGWAHAELIGDGRVGNKPLGSDFSYFDPTNLMEVMAAAQAFWNTENFWVHITYHQGTFQVTIQEPDADDPKFEILGHNRGLDLAQAVMEDLCAGQAEFGRRNAHLTLSIANPRVE